VQRFTPTEYAEWNFENSSKKHLTHYIRYFGDIIPPDMCDDLVMLFDDNEDLQVERTQGGDHFRFMQLSISQQSNQQPWKAIQEILTECARNALSQYADLVQTDQTPIFPKELGLEEFRINKTLNNGRDGFGNHVDVGDYKSARRFITAVFYLNDIEDGGDAAFPELGISFKPTKGAALVFPSTWQFIHCGIKPISDPKYILTTFVHYV